MMQKKKLYGCSSYYQLLISLMKAMDQNEKIDLFLEVHGLETARELSMRLPRMLGEWVDRVYVCDNSDKIDPYVQRCSSFVPWQRHKLLQHMKNVLEDRKIEEYQEIHLFWDLGFLGTYCNIKGIHYTLHEDSLNSYQHIQKNRPHYSYIYEKRKIKFFLKKIFRAGVIPFGYSPYCDKVEVNDKTGIEIPLNKVTESSRIQLEQRLTSEQKKKIFAAFTAGMSLDIEEEGAGVLLLTEPFAATGRLPDIKTQERLYRDILDTYASGKKVFIKPHPRDELDYEICFPDAVVLAKDVPMEVLNFDPRFCFSRAITVSSSAIQGISGAEEKIYLGAEFWKKYQR